MASSRSALLLAAACCVALAGCPRVTGLKGNAFELANGPAGMVERGLARGAGIDEGATIRVDPGAAVTIEFDDGCSETYEAGTHTVRNPCAADEDSDDLDRDDDDGDDESREERDPTPDDATPADPSQPIVRGSRAVETGGVVLGAVAGIAAIIEAIADDDDAAPPLSP